MKLIETKTLTVAAASIEFTSIPQTFTDLVLLSSARTDRAENFGDVITIRPNGSTSGISGRRLYGTGSTSVSNTTSFIPAAMASTTNQTSNTFGNSICYIPNYTSANQKSFSLDGVSENNAVSAIQIISAGLWTGTSAITSFILIAEFGALQIGSVFSLYGVTKGSDGIVTVS